MRHPLNVKQQGIQNIHNTPDTPRAHGELNTWSRKADKEHLQEAMPPIHELLKSPSVSDRLKIWIREAINGDPIDALRDVELLRKVLSQHIRDTRLI